MKIKYFLFILIPMMGFGQIKMNVDLFKKRYLFLERIEGVIKLKNETGKKLTGESLVKEPEAYFLSDDGKKLNLWILSMVYDFSSKSLENGKKLAIFFVADYSYHLKVLNASKVKSKELFIEFPDVAGYEKKGSVIVEFEPNPDTLQVKFYELLYKKSKDYKESQVTKKKADGFFMNNQRNFTDNSITYQIQRFCLRIQGKTWYDLEVKYKKYNTDKIIDLMEEYLKCKVNHGYEVKYKGKRKIKVYYPQCKEFIKPMERKLVKSLGQGNFKRLWSEKMEYLSDHYISKEGVFVNFNNHFASLITGYRKDVKND